MASATAQKYDFSYFETSPKKLEGKQNLRVVEGGKRARSKPEAFAINAGYVIAAAVALAMVILMLVSNVQINELSGKVDAANEKLTQSQSQYSYLTSRYNSIASLSNVQDEAQELGLMPVDKSQITYVRTHAEGTLYSGDDINLATEANKLVLCVSSLFSEDLQF
jgi:cell division protein FtsL